MTFLYLYSLDLAIILREPVFCYAIFGGYTAGLLGIKRVTKADDDPEQSMLGRLQNPSNE
ncbi:hypothetical protein N7472_004548 [Penicillium cf. griseofulvum]|uniref:Uncharacterized protein n=1 Tax=Penicillium cf. griseofulvum TaxID=2972120 RepID=A0A9W9MEZ3_9EURO|nr:hypothetical protein N7472_004548 [Penicillium cf. griseofulvum]